MNEDIDSYLESKEQKSKMGSKFYSNMKPAYVILLALLFLIGWHLIKTNENNKFIYIIVGVIFILYIFSVMKASQTGKIIPRHIAQDIAHQDLLREIGPNRVYPTGTTIFPTGYCYLQSVDDGKDGMVAFKYHLGFKVKKPNKPETDIVYLMHPYTGESKGIKKMPLGFEGQEIQDIKLVFPETIKKEEKKD